MKIYTRGGDGGETVLIGGVRVRKDDPRVEAYGSVDELGAALGLAVAAADGVIERQPLLDLQSDLFTIGSHLASVDPDRAEAKGTIPSLDPERSAALERWIDSADEELAALDNFVLSGGSELAARLHLARTICRRAERAIVRLLPERPTLDQVVVPYMNRLSDLLFTLARLANARTATPDVPWVPLRRREDG